MKNKKRVVLISGGDRWLVPLVAKALRERAIDLKTIKIRANRTETGKKLKLLALFGVAATINVILDLLKNRNFSYDLEIDESEIYNITNYVDKDEFILLMNLPLKFPLQDFPIYNFHPSLLPSFRGLMSIPNITLAKLEDKQALIGASIHEIDDSFDTGRVVWQRAFSNQSAHQNMKHVYEQCYLNAADGVAELLAQCEIKAIAINTNIASNSKILSWTDVLYIWWLKILR